MVKRPVAIAMLLLVTAAAGVWWQRDALVQVAGPTGTAGKPQTAAPGSAKGNGSASGAKGPSGPAPAVEVARPKRDLVQVEITAVGTLRSDESVAVSAEIDGRVEEVLFAEGEPVKAGQPLFRLDRGIQNAELQQARAALALGRANFGRISALAASSTATGRQRDEAQAALQSAQAEVALAEARLDRTLIAAPFDGVAGLRLIDRGAHVKSGQALVNVEKIDKLKVDFEVSEVFLARLKVGQDILVEVDARPGERFEGQVIAIDPALNIAGRSVRLRASLENRGDLLRPGLFARVRLIAERRLDALLVPESAIVPQGSGFRVFTVKDGKALSKAVGIGLRQPGLVEILNGLGGDELVVIAGQMRLRDGAAVTIVGTPPAAAPVAGAKGPPQPEQAERPAAGGKAGN